jgi:hypothetical protein
MAVGHESVVADALESVGQDVHQEAADEFVRIQGHRLVGKARLVVLVGEGDSAVFDLYEAMVGDGDAVGVPREVIHDGVGSGKGRLSIDDPFELTAPIEEIPKDLGLPVRFELAVKLQAPVVMDLP